MGGSQQQPDVVHPGEAAQAAVGAAAAGEQMAIANQPVEQYGQLYTTQQLGPAQMRTQTALANQAALQAAQAQQDIQSRVDPQAYAQRQMRMNAANQRLGQLTAQNPANFNYRAPNAFTIPGTTDIPPLSALTGAGRQIASNLSTASVNRQGGDPRLNAPTIEDLTTPTYARTYLS